MIRPVNWMLGHFFRGFNWVFDRATRAYGKSVGWCLRLSAIVLLVYVGLIGLTGFGFTRVPAGFIPTQDKGRLVVNVQLPDSASLERTTEVMDKIEKIALETPGVAHIIANRGRSFILNAVSSNLGSAFLPLQPFHERRDPSLSADAIAARAPPAVSARGPRSPGERLRGTGGGRPGDGRRLQADGGSDGRRELRCPPGPGRRRWPPRATGSPASSASSPSSAPARPSSTSTWTGPRSRRWGCN